MEGNKKHFRKRDAILTCLKETTVHPSAEWIYAQLKPSIPDLSLGTVYRNLAAFKTEGVIASVDGRHVRCADAPVRRAEAPADPADPAGT